MPFEGVLVNATVTLAASACYLAVAFAVHRRKGGDGKKSRSAVAYFALIGVFLLIGALRQTAAYLGAVNPGFPPVDYWLCFVVPIPGAFTVVPLMHFTSYAMTGSSRTARLVASVFAAIAILGVGTLYAGGITGPDTSYWGSDFSINSTLTKILMLVFLTLPAIIASFMLVFTGSKMHAGAGRRFTLIGWSTLLYYVCFTIDALRLDGIAFIVVRLGTLTAGLVAYAAYANRSASPANASESNA